MLYKINLYNFQSHQQTELELDPGINAIVGPSDNGKSAVIRGLLWARYNQPLGDAFVSHWARNEKGKQEAPSSVQVLRGDKATIVRTKSPTFNGYSSTEWNDLEAIGRGPVPEEVDKFFNMGEVNIQKQMDSPFLLADSPNDVARFWNGLVNLTVIDKYMSAADSKKRALAAEIRAVEAEVKADEEELAKLDWIDSAEKLYSKLERLSSRISTRKAERDSLTSSVDRYKATKVRVDSLANIGAVEKLLKKVSNVGEKKRKLSKELSELGNGISQYQAASRRFRQFRGLPQLEEQLKALKIAMENHDSVENRRIQLNQSIVSYKKARAAINSLRDLPGLIKSMAKIEKIQQRISKKREELNQIHGQCKQYKLSRNLLAQTTEGIKELQALLPDECPLCHQPMPKGGSV